eukprot:12582082-Alexandrium_andersonii.AAC.1
MAQRQHTVAQLYTRNQTCGTDKHTDIRRGRDGDRDRGRDRENQSRRQTDGHTHTHAHTHSACISLSAILVSLQVKAHTLQLNTVTPATHDEHDSATRNRRKLIVARAGVEELNRR